MHTDGDLSRQCFQPGTVRYRLQEGPLWALMLLSMIGRELPIKLAGQAPSKMLNSEKPETLVIKSSLREPAVPIELVVTARLFAKTRLIHVEARVGRHPAYPAAAFSDKDVELQIKLPAELQLQEGSLSWKGDLKGDQVGQVQATVKAVRDLENAVEVSAVGHAAIGGRVDADSVLFHVLARGTLMKVSRNAFAPLEMKPGTAGQVR